MAAGIDSLGAAELATKLSDSTGLQLPGTLMFDHPTADAVVEYLVCELGGGETTVNEVALPCSCDEAIEEGSMIIWPSRDALLAMDGDALSSVKNFTIEFYGICKVKFPGVTNFVDFDIDSLDNVVVLKNGRIKLYPKIKTRPPLNVGLNKPFHVTVYSYPPPAGCSPADYETALHTTFEWTYSLVSADL